MGNRASISIPKSNTLIYLHWNGGKGSVQAFVEEAKKRNGGNVMTGNNYHGDKTSDLFTMHLFACIRDFFNFSSNYRKERDNMTVYIYDKKTTKVCNEDNGHYRIREDGTIDFSLTKYIEPTDYTTESYNTIKQWFNDFDKHCFKLTDKE